MVLLHHRCHAPKFHQKLHQNSFFLRINPNPSSSRLFRRRHASHAFHFEGGDFPELRDWGQVSRREAVQGGGGFRAARHRVVGGWARGGLLLDEDPALALAQTARAPNLRVVVQQLHVGIVQLPVGGLGRVGVCWFICDGAIANPNPSAIREILMKAVSPQ